MKSNKLILILLIHLLCSCREVIVHNLSEAEANKILAKLVTNKLDASKERQADGKWSLQLPTDQTIEAIRYLSEQRLLKDETVSLPEKGSLMASREEQRFRYERSLSREIENTLSGLNGVLQARVHLNLPIVDPIFGQSIDNSKSSASVLLVINAEFLEKSDVTALVAGASGIPIGSISVMVSNSKSSTEEIENSIAQNLAPVAKVTNIKVSSMNTTALRDTFKTAWSFFLNLPVFLITLSIGVLLIAVAVLRFLNRREKLII